MTVDTEEDQEWCDEQIGVSEGVVEILRNMKIFINVEKLGKSVRINSLYLRSKGHNVKISVNTKTKRVIHLNLPYELLYLLVKASRNQCSSFWV